MEKKGVSPVIATVLLIAMVIVIGLIVFMWFRGMTQEAVTKFDGTNIELVCEDVDFSAEYSGGVLSIVNNGNVPIYGMLVQVYADKSYNTADLNGFQGLTAGDSFSGSLDASGAEKIILVPVLLGSSDKGEVTYTCDENKHGYEIVLS